MLKFILNWLGLKCKMKMKFTGFNDSLNIGPETSKSVKDNTNVSA